MADYLKFPNCSGNEERIDAMRHKVLRDGKLKSRDAFTIASAGFLIVLTFVVWLGDFNFMYKITSEDGLVENLTALFFLLASGSCVYLLIFKPRTNYKAFLILWALLSFVFLGEETSWFQRVLDIPTPEAIEAVNEQGELNIHNLRWFVGEHGLAEALKERDQILGAVFNSDNIFRMGFFTYFFLIPMLVYIKKFPWIEEKLNYPTPNLVFFASLWLTILLAVIPYVYSSGERQVILLAETREMTFAAFIFIYSVTHLGRGRPSSDEAD